MAEVRVRFRERVLEVCAGSVRELQERLHELTGVPPRAQRLLAKGGKRVAEGDDVEALAGTTPLKLVGSTEAERAMAEEAPAADVEVWDDLDVDYEAVQEERERGAAAKARAARLREAERSEYRFREVRVLEQFRDSHKARELLEDLAGDPGFVAVLREHRWTVGALTEMYPDGKVGVDPVCVLGVNVNKGQEISLRLRTDDLRGFRKLQVIRETLCHELAHMVWGDHDANFYQLMRQVQREVVHLDWRQGQGRALGGREYLNPGVLRRSVPAGAASPGGRRLGGSGESRLLVDRAAAPEAAPDAAPNAAPAILPEVKDEADQQQESQDQQQESQDQQQESQDQQQQESQDQEQQESQDQQQEPHHQEPQGPKEEQAPSSPPPAAATETPASLAPLIDYELEPPDEDWQQRLRAAVARVVEQNDPRVALRGLRLVERVLGNILREPEASKYRSLRLDNHKVRDNVSAVFGIRHLLGLVGWQADAERLHFDGTSPQALGACAFARDLVRESAELAAALAS